MSITVGKSYNVVDVKYHDYTPRPAVVISTTLPGDYPVGFYYLGDPAGEIRRAQEDGFLQGSTRLCLVEAKPKVQCEVWLYCREEPGPKTIHASISHPTKQAKILARYTIDVEEGHGLEKEPVIWAQGEDSSITLGPQVMRSRGHGKVTHDRLEGGE